MGPGKGTIGPGMGSMGLNRNDGARIETMGSRDGRNDKSHCRIHKGPNGNGRSLYRNYADEKHRLRSIPPARSASRNADAERQWWSALAELHVIVGEQRGSERVREGARQGR